MALPVVTAKDLHTVRVDPRLAHLLHRRARKANERAYAPILAADRGGAAEARRIYGTEKAATRGATNLVESGLTQALRGLKGSGLKGGYLRQAQNEILARQSAATDAIPYLLAEAAQAKSKAIGEAHQQIRTDRAQMLQGTAEDFNQLLKEARGAGSSLEKERADRRRSKREEEQEPGGGKYSPTSLENAKIELRNALAAWAKNPVVSVELPDGSEAEKRLKEVNPLRTREDWARFAKGLVDSTSGFGAAELNHVIRELLRNKPQKEHEGRLPQPGVPGYGRGL